ncbi:MAG: LysM peptidoglycan-binding domain-containing protein [Planctomycetota bacterium]
MDDRAGRWLVGVAALVGLWIVVYWLWEPGGPSRDEQPSPVAPFVQSVVPDDADGSLDIVDPLAGGAVRGGIAESGPSTPPQPDPASPEPTDPVATRVEPPEFRDYTVRRNETMETIARREYGSVRFWTAIANANPLLDPNRLRVGRVIRLPVDPGNIQGRVVEAEPSGGASPTEPETTPPAVIEYRVERGDTLGAIASRFYGSSAWTEFLFQANRDRLSTPNAIRIGQTLVIPPKPAGEAP